MNNPSIIFIVLFLSMMVGCGNESNIVGNTAAETVNRVQNTADVTFTPISTVKPAKTVSPAPTPEYETKVGATSNYLDSSGLDYNINPRLGEHYKPAWIEDEKSDNGFEPFCVQTKIRGKKIEKCSYQDAGGKILIKPTFDTVFVFSEGLAGVCPQDEKHCGYIDEKGQIIIEPIYKLVDIFSEGLAKVTTGARNTSNHDMVGYINKNGQSVIAPQYDKGEPFRKGIVRVRLRKLAFCINEKNERLKCPE